MKQRDSIIITPLGDPIEDKPPIKRNPYATVTTTDLETPLNVITPRIDCTNSFFTGLALQSFKNMLDNNAEAFAHSDLDFGCNDDHPMQILLKSGTVSIFSKPI